jgi:hypothetical protein
MKAATARYRARLCKSLAEQDHGRIGTNAVKRSESIIEDFHSIGRYLNRLENERARGLSAPVVLIKEGKSEERTSISQLWINGKI